MSELTSGQRGIQRLDTKLETLGLGQLPENLRDASRALFAVIITAPNFVLAGEMTPQQSADDDDVGRADRSGVYHRL